VIPLSVSKVAIALNPSRVEGTKAVVDAIGMPELRGKHVFIKPNFNTSDPAPGSTHDDSLRAIVELCRQAGSKSMVVGDRSGPANTRRVFDEKGIFDMGRELGFECLVLDELPPNRWTRFVPPNGSWKKGFLFAKPAVETDAVIGLCCLKTHRYGGHFTMSLKLGVGLVHRRNMAELHSSLSKQRKMIAEINAAYAPALVVMDGVEAFYKGGPMKGPRWKSDLTFASRDRIALDAVGVAALKMHGTTRTIENKTIFEHDQIRRAVELGIGVSSPDEIEIVPAGEGSEAICRDIERFLHR
jgi:uncharacterized protein (DUF362 family)